MPLVALLTRDPGVQRAVQGALRDMRSVATARSWERLSWLVRERPATAAVIDSAALSSGVAAEAPLSELGRRFPSVGTVFLSRPHLDPHLLFRLGRAGIAGLVLMPVDALMSGVSSALRTTLATSTTSTVVRVVSPRLPARETGAVRLALEGVQRGWNAEVLAEHSGLSRAHLSVRLKACGLPSAGHLLVWAKLLHAGRWLTDPGRSAESVSRQLEYSSGAAFRRALRNYVGTTPTQLKALGGLRGVLRRFLDECGIDDSVQLDRSVA